jgi:transposase-like protein
VARLRWPDGPTCPRCEGTQHSYLTTRRVWKCKACKKQFSVKVGTIFEDSPLGLDKWLPAVWLAANSKNGISSHELGRALGVTQKSAWFMLHRIRLAMQTGSFRKLSGTVEVDETFIGGKARNMHASARRRKIKGGRGTVGKVTVLGIIERDGEVRAELIPDTTRGTLKRRVSKHVETGATVYTDALASYSGLDDDYHHAVVDMPRSTSMGRSTRIGWRTSGRCSSAVCTAPTSASSRSTCSGTSMNESSRSTCAIWTTSGASSTFSRPLPADGLPTPT